MTEVSVIIPTFNRADKILRAVSSILDQSFRDYEIIVVNDGSDDNTDEILASYRDNIHYIIHNKNLGVSAARNSGIKVSQSPLIAFLDSDDYWLPEKLDVQVKFFRDNIDAVASQTDEIWIRNGVRVNPRVKHFKPSGDIFEPSLKLCLVSPSAVMLRRNVLDEVGLFDEQLPVCEDYDLWLRISCRYPIHLIDKRLVVKEGGNSDQLSSRLKGMDRFRIMAMIKLLKNGQLNKKQISSVVNELEIKSTIYGEGCIKRGKMEEGSYYLKLPNLIKKEFIDGDRLDGPKSPTPPEKS
jgi:glycosyltransferase involved in cell wall biosynthesis